MSRVFWDAMLFIYLLEDDRRFAPLVIKALTRSRQRGDLLFTSYLSLAEALVGLPEGSPMAALLQQTILEMGFTFVAFDQGAVESFRMLRRNFRLKQPDLMHLACAAAARTDLFLTGDKQLLKKQLHVPGIHFIADFERPPL